MGRMFWNDSIDAPLGDRPSNIERGYRYLAREAQSLDEELAGMASRVNARIAQREQNRALSRDVTDPDLDLDAQAKFDAYYRGHQHKLRRLRALLMMIGEAATTPESMFSGDVTAPVAAATRDE